MISGTLTIFNPKTGQVVELKKGECINLPKAAPHKGYNFTQETCEMLYLIVPSVWQKGEAGPPPYNEEDMIMLDDLRAQQGSRKSFSPRGHGSCRQRNRLLAGGWPERSRDRRICKSE